MKEIEKSITDGWTIFPPVHTQKARRWIKAAEAVPETADPAGSDRQQDHKEESNQLFLF